ncbi:MAG TPA: MmgE/PrpD family protein [Bosea sp. (in: a-proteobacteria)]|uniref:MmgE/PrpD family protein n=1 Tax=Bosea sp. (in: a-proteobacteria) TaxID=1871050 RepID=UPI002E1119F6|nr:MmgE/PrpD family protein [Bosea sp. (in: a-proteobacteria)]
MEIVRRLAAYVAEARDQPLSADLREAASRAVLDLVAAAAAGIAAPGPRAVRQVVDATMAGGDLPVWFAGRTSGLAGAIWCNASAAAALDLDDGHRIARGHPGAAVIPAVLAVAQQASATTEELLQAIVVGYEVGVSVGAARRFYANTGMWSGYGVVAALGFLRRTPPEQLAHAFAIAGIGAPNQLHAGAGPAFRAQEGSDVKEGIPWSSVTAAGGLLMAEAGHTGPLGLLDNDEHFRLEGLADGLGRQHYITRNYMKFLACCRHCHAPVEALLGVMTRNAIDPHHIEAIEVATYSGALRLANRPRPQSFTDIQFSIPYCLGLVALDGIEALMPLADSAVDRLDVIALAEKVALRLDPELDARFPAETLSRVTVRAAGQSFVSPVTAPSGEASAAPSWEDLEDKLRRASRIVATPAQQERLLDALRRLRAGDHMPFFAALAEIRLGQG